MSKIVFYGEMPTSSIIPEYDGYCITDIGLLDILHDYEKVIDEDQYKKMFADILIRYERDKSCKWMFFRKDNGGVVFDDDNNEYKLPVILDLEKYYNENKYMCKYYNHTIYSYSYYGEEISEDDYYESGLSDECSMLPNYSKRYIYKKID